MASTVHKLPVTHEERAVSRAKQAGSIVNTQTGISEDARVQGAVVANVGMALVHALLALRDSVDDLARQVER